MLRVLASGVFLAIALASAGCSEREGVCLSKNATSTQWFCAPAAGGTCAAATDFVPLDPKFKSSGKSAVERERGMCGGLGYLCGGSLACTKELPP